MRGIDEVALRRMATGCSVFVRVVVHGVGAGTGVTEVSQCVMSLVDIELNVTAQ